ncbi:hypothetical protein BCR43DRAFT_483374 [Syncephalastrum racemosum]|uniref:CUE domain-containing protein n=1 Tax=Syncephalastrum racemosum TaxID=13706 RepID=A0A1X2HV14_SYNRA|nr:hypothetical protein BCR43DRAFT_483374 [Syncephalastrum racemosum]
MAWRSFKSRESVFLAQAKSRRYISLLVHEHIHSLTMSEQHIFDGVKEKDENSPLTSPSMDASSQQQSSDNTDARHNLHEPPPSSMPTSPESKPKQEHPQKLQQEQEQLPTEQHTQQPEQRQGQVQNQGQQQPQQQPQEQEQEQEQHRRDQQTTGTMPDQQQNLEDLPPSVRTLKEAFPDTDVEIIEAIVDSQGGNVERSFEVLLGMSDPDYTPEQPPRPSQPTQPTQQQDAPAPPMPPRPTTQGPTTNAPYGYYQEQHQQQQQQQNQPRTVEEQMRLDEEYARQLAMEDERARVQQYRQRQQQQQQAEEDQPLFNFQEDLPIIKERVMEGANAAKKKVMDLYTQFRTGRSPAPASPGGTSMPATNAQYRGLPSDEGDDLLAGDVSALRLSDNDVYAQTGRPAPTTTHHSTDIYGDNEPGVIHVNPTHNRTRELSVEDQIRADEELARRMAQEERYWRNREPRPSQQQQQQGQQQQQQQPQLDGDTVTLTAPDKVTSPPTAASATELPPKFSTSSDKRPEEEQRRSYVIRDEDDSDDDDLVDIEDELPEHDRKPTEKKV